MSSIPALGGRNVPSASGHNPRAAFDAKVIKASDFQQAVGSGKVVVEFFSYGCGYCRNAVPEVVAASQAMARSGIKTVALEINDPAAMVIARRHGLSLYPTFAVFDNGQHVGTFARDGRNPVTARFVSDNVSRLYAAAPRMNS